MITPTNCYELIKCIAAGNKLIDYDATIHAMAEMSSEVKYDMLMGGSMQPKGLDTTLLVALLADAFGYVEEKVAIDFHMTEKRLYEDHFSEFAPRAYIDPTKSPFEN